MEESSRVTVILSDDTTYVKLLFTCSCSSFDIESLL